MIGETHKRIARMVSNQLKLNPKDASLLENGSIAPDSWQNFPHHHGKESEIIENIIQAHSLFLKNDDECYHRLGVALHYIQDRWTLRPRISDAHTKWERAINLANYWEDDNLKKIIDGQTLPSKAQTAYLEFITRLKNGINNPEFPLTNEIAGIPLFSNLTYLNCFSEFGLKVLFFALQARPSDWSTPTIDYNIACRISSEIAKNILTNDGEQNPWFDAKKQVEKNIEIKNEIDEERRHRTVTWISMFAFFATVFFVMGLVARSSEDIIIQAMGSMCIAFGIFFCILALGFFFSLIKQR